MKSSLSSKATLGAKAAHAPQTLKDKIFRMLGPALSPAHPMTTPAASRHILKPAHNSVSASPGRFYLRIRLWPPSRRSAAASDELPGRGSRQIYANIIRIGCCRALSRWCSDLGAMGDAATLLIGGPRIMYIGLFAVLCALLQVLIVYSKYVSVLKWLTLALFAYFL